MPVSTHSIISAYQAAYRSMFGKPAPKVGIASASGKKFRIYHREGNMLRTETEMKLITGFMNEMKGNADG